MRFLALVSLALGAQAFLSPVNLPRKAGETAPLTRTNLMAPKAPRDGEITTRKADNSNYERWVKAVREEQREDIDIGATIQQAVHVLDDMVQDAMSKVANSFNIPKFEFKEEDINQFTSQIRDYFMMKPTAGISSAPAQEVPATKLNYRRSDGPEPDPEDEDEIVLKGDSMEEMVVQRVAVPRPEIEVADELIVNMVESMATRRVPVPREIPELPDMSEEFEELMDAAEAMEYAQFKPKEETPVVVEEPLMTKVEEPVTAFVAPKEAEVAAKAAPSFFQFRKEKVETKKEEVPAPYFAAVVDDFKEPAMLDADKAFEPVAAVPLAVDSIMTEAPKPILLETPKSIVAEPAKPAVIERPKRTFGERARTTAVEAPKPMNVQAPKPIAMEPVVAEEMVKPAFESVTTAPVMPKVEKIIAEPAAESVSSPRTVRPVRGFTSALTSDTPIYTPRKSVEEIFVDYQQQAVKNYNEAKAASVKTSFEEKIALVEQRLEKEAMHLEESKDGIMRYVDALEKLGDKHRVWEAETHDGSWELIYSNVPAYVYLGLPKWSESLLKSVKYEVNTEEKSVVYRAIFGLALKWLPTFTAKFGGTFQGINKRKAVELVTPKNPVSSLWSLRHKLPLVRPTNTATSSPVVRVDYKLLNNCTYLGNTVKICRMAAAEDKEKEVLAVFRRVTAEELEEEANAPTVVAGVRTAFATVVAKVKKVVGAILNKDKEAAFAM